MYGMPQGFLDTLRDGLSEDVPFFGHPLQFTPKPSNLIILVGQSTRLSAIGPPMLLDPLVQAVGRHSEPFGYLFNRVALLPSPVEPLPA